MLFEHILGWRLTDPIRALDRSERELKFNLHSTSRYDQHNWSICKVKWPVFYFGHNISHLKFCKNIAENKRYKKFENLPVSVNISHSGSATFCVNDSNILFSNGNQLKIYPCKKQIRKKKNKLCVCVCVCAILTFFILIL